MIPPELAPWLALVPLSWAATALALRLDAARSDRRRLARRPSPDPAPTLLPTAALLAAEARLAREQAMVDGAWRRDRARRAEHGLDPRPAEIEAVARYAAHQWGVTVEAARGEIADALLGRPGADEALRYLRNALAMLRAGHADMRRFMAEYPVPGYHSDGLPCRHWKATPLPRPDPRLSNPVQK